jgi:nitrogen fixation protein FixH
MKTYRNLWPYGIILAFILFISGTVGLVVMACSQRVDLVSKNYYEQELKFQGQIDRAGRANQLATQASAKYDPGRKCIIVSLPRQHAGLEVAGHIELYRPAAAGLDQRLELRPDSTGIQAVDASTLSPGLWKVRLSWFADKQDYFAEQRVVIGPKGS